MTTNELKQMIVEAIERERWIQIYFVLKNEGQFVIKLADIDSGDTATELLKMYYDYLKKVIIDNDEISILALSNADERTNAIYEYDYDEFPDEIECIRSFKIEDAIQFEHFSFINDSLSNLYGYLIYIGTMDNGTVLFKKHYPISLIKRDSFMLRKQDERFVKYDGKELVRLNETAQLIKIQDHLFVIDLSALERSFGFEHLIRKRANEVVEIVANKGLLEDVQVLIDSMEDISFARKLSKVKNMSPIFQLNISNNSIVEFTKKCPGLIGKFKYGQDERTIRLDTKESKRAFAKLLSDDYLRSELTNLYYDSLAKDSIVIPTE